MNMTLNRATRFASVAESASTASPPVDRSRAGTFLLAALLGLEGGLAFALGVGLSMVAGALDRRTAVGVEFIAAAAVIFAIVSYFAARGSLRRRPWSYTLAAMLQLVMALSLGLAAFANGWQAPYVGAFGLAGAIMVTLSAQSVRTALDQG